MKKYSHKVIFNGYGISEGGTVKIRQSAAIVAIAVCAQGCATVEDTKTIVITPEPGATQVVVDSRAWARCKDIVFIITCNLDLSLAPAKAANVATSPPENQSTTVVKPPQALPPVNAPVAAVMPQSSDASTSPASKRLQELEQLRVNGQITDKEYKNKRQEILRNL